MEWMTILKVAKQYKLSSEQTIMLLAIRDVENGPIGFEFGVKAAKGTDLETQAKWAAGSIKLNTERYNELKTTGLFKGERRVILFVDGDERLKTYVEAFGKNVSTVKKDIDFPEFMGYYGSPTGMGWAPIDAKELPEKEIERNKNWVGNVRDSMSKIRKEFEQKGMEVK